MSSQKIEIVLIFGSTLTFQYPFMPIALDNISMRYSVFCDFFFAVFTKVLHVCRTSRVYIVSIVRKVYGINYCAIGRSSERVLKFNIFRARRSQPDRRIKRLFPFEFCTNNICVFFFLRFASIVIQVFGLRTSDCEVAFQANKTRRRTCVHTECTRSVRQTR